MDNFNEATPSRPDDELSDRNPQGDMTQKPRLTDALIEANHLIDGLKWPVFKRILIFLLMAVLTPLVITVSITFIMTSQVELFIHNYPWVVSSTIRTIILFVAIVIWVQMIMLGVKRATGLPLYLEVINAECLHMKWDLVQLAILLLLLHGLVSYLTPLPSMLLPDFMKALVLYLLYWIATLPIYIFAIPEVITQKQTATSALKNAFSKAALCWKKIAVSFGILYLAIVLFLIVLGIIYFLIPGLQNQRARLIIEIILLILSVGIVPLYVALSAVLFRDAYLNKTRQSG